MYSCKPHFTIYKCGLRGIYFTDMFSWCFMVERKNRQEENVDNDDDDDNGDYEGTEQQMFAFI